MQAQVTGKKLAGVAKRCAGMQMSISADRYQNWKQER